jgi:hypothetical protein
MRAAKAPNAPPQTDATIQARTGRDWKAWCELLDAAGAMQLDHPSIVAIVEGLHDAGGWWSQAVVVGYERIRGKRVLNARADGSFSANASKTIAVPREAPREWVVDDRRRARWAPAGVTLSTNRSDRTLSLRDSEGHRVQLFLHAKDDTRTAVSIEVMKLADARAMADAKAAWKAALETLAALAAA